ncbi:MAG: hypothetical protein ACOX8Q_00460 [Christensenellales bacterium]|jgi:hypothetical protein
MYCKKCGKDYPKEKRVCKDCGIALTPGVSPVSKKRGIKRMLIIGSAMIVIVVAVFLIIGLGGMVPSKLKGTWYETTGLGGTLEFKPYGVLQYKIMGHESEGSYQYDGAIEEGNMTRQIGNEPRVSEFTCDGITIELDGATFTKKYVQQQDLGSLIKDQIPVK